MKRDVIVAVVAVAVTLGLQRLRGGGGAGVSAAREAARPFGPGGDQGPLEPLEPRLIVETLKSRFAPGEKPTTEKVRDLVADITADAERRWASSPLARVVADCKAGKMDDFLAVAAPSAPAEARRERCAAEAPRWRADILKAYEEEAGTARAALEALKAEVRLLTPGEGEAVQETVAGLTRPIDAALERLDGRSE